MPEIETKMVSKLKDIVKRHNVSLEVLYSTFRITLFCTTVILSQGSVVEDKEVATHLVYAVPPPSPDGKEL